MGRRRRLRLDELVHINATLYVLLAYEAFCAGFFIDFSLRCGFNAVCMFIHFCFDKLDNVFLVNVDVTHHIERANFYGCQSM